LRNFVSKPKAQHQKRRRKDKEGLEPLKEKGATVPSHRLKKAEVGTAERSIQRGTLKRGEEKGLSAPKRESHSGHGNPSLLDSTEELQTVEKPFKKARLHAPTTRDIRTTLTRKGGRENLTGARSRLGSE